MRTNYNEYDITAALLSVAGKSQKGGDLFNMVENAVYSIYHNAANSCNSDSWRVLWDVLQDIAENNQT